MNIIPTFETGRLILKEILEKDYIAYQDNFDDYEVIRYLSSAVPWPYPKDGAKKFIKDFIIPNQGKDRWMWGIFLKKKPSELIGVVDLWREEKPENRGFWLGKKYWRQGYMTEAVVPVTRYAFNELGFEKLIFSNAVGNVGSRRVKEKTGAKFLRVAPFEFVDPQFTDCEIWEVSKESWIDSN